MIRLFFILTGSLVMGWITGPMIVGQCAAVIFSPENIECFSIRLLVIGGYFIALYVLSYFIVKK